MKRAILTILILLVVTSLMAQRFEKSVGVRVGQTNAIFFDVQNKDLSSYRFMLSWREEGTQFTAMKYYHLYKLDNFPDYISVYYGYGVHAGFTKWDQYYRNTEHGYYWDEASAPVFGLDGLIGLSYDFKRVPMSITCELKPFFDFWGKKIFSPYPFDFAVCAVYCF